MARKASTLSISTVSGLASALRGKVKATTRPAEPARKERRLISAPLNFLGGAQHRRNHAHMTAATAQIAGQGGANIGFLGAWIAVQQRRSRHDHAVCAITALRRGF